MTKHKSTPLPTPAELSILRVLWQLDKGTVEQIVNGFPARKRPNYKTTQAFLRILERKGFVRHTVQGRVFVFEPIIAKQEVDRQSVQALLRQNFGGSASGMLVNLFESDAITPGELDTIEHLIRSYRRRKREDFTLE